VYVGSGQYGGVILSLQSVFITSCAISREVGSAEENHWFTLGFFFIMQPHFWQTALQVQRVQQFPLKDF